MTRVAVIGAGPCGLSQLQAFNTAKANGAEIPEVVCYEKQSDLGGLWNYTWRTGLDENGEAVHGSMYRYLWSNGPKECLEFADYTFDDHFGKPIGSFPPRAVLYDYIVGRADKFGLRDYIQFNTSVQSVVYNSATDGGSDGRGSEGRFTVTIDNHESGERSSSEFDHVVVATGHFSTPNMPHYPGYDSFPGRILHAHDFRDAVEFADKNVLIIGGSYSAEDVGSQCWKYGAKSVTFSVRHGPMGFDWPEGCQEKPGIDRVEGKTVHFTDGTSTEIDAIVSCTGYKHHFPFMAPELQLKTANVLACDMLYQGVVFQPNNKIMYLGMQDQWYTFNMFDAQAWYARDVIMGRIDLPSPDEQAGWIADFVALEGEVTDDYGLIDFQGAYTKALVEATDHPNIDTDMIDAMFKTWKGHKKADIMAYRDNGHQSPFTGTEAPIHHTPWVQAMDDSLEDFLAEK